MTEHDAVLPSELARRHLLALLDAETHWIFLAGPEGFRGLHRLAGDLLHDQRDRVVGYVFDDFPAAALVVPRALVAPEALVAWLATTLHFRVAPAKLATMGIITLGRDDPTTACLAWIGGLSAAAVRGVHSGEVVEFWVDEERGGAPAP